MAGRSLSLPNPNEDGATSLGPGMIQGQTRTRKGLNRPPCLNLPLPFSQDRAGMSAPCTPMQPGHQPWGQSVLSPAPRDPRNTPGLTAFLPTRHALLRGQHCLDLERHKLALLQLLQGAGRAAPKHVVFHLEGQRGQPPSFPFRSLPLPLAGRGHVGDHLPGEGRGWASRGHSGISSALTQAQ